MNADLFGPRPEQPPVRHDAVDTSRAAAARIAPVWTGIKRLCLEAIIAEGASGLTCDELAADSGLSILSVRPAVCMLAKGGAIVDSGGRRRNERGNTAIVWVAAPGLVPGSGGRAAGPVGGAGGG